MHGRTRVRERRGGGVTDVTTLDPAFLDAREAMTDDEIVAPFPAILEIVPRRVGASRMIYLASDLRYFELFTLPLLGALDTWQPDAGIHIHVMDGAPDD